jgi:hypothetical protein
MQMRTDRNRNPLACTTDIAKQAGLILGIDYIYGDAFPVPSPLITARFLKDPIETSISILDRVGYYTKTGIQRWAYMAIPPELWVTFSHGQKVRAVACHYKHEGGTEMIGLFTNLAS